MSATPDPIVDLIKWITRVLVGLYVIVIIIFTVSVILWGKEVSLEIIGSITGLLTTVLGGLLATILRKRRRS